MCFVWMNFQIGRGGAMEWSPGIFDLSIICIWYSVFLRIMSVRPLPLTLIGTDHKGICGNRSRCSPTRHNVTSRRVRVIIFAVEKQWVLYGLSVRICSLQFACAMLSSVTYPALQYFSTLSHKRLDFLERDTESKICVFWFSVQLLPETFIILRSNERDMIKMYIGLHVKYPLFLSDFNEMWIFSTEFRKILRYQISWKIRPVGAELFHAGRWTDGRT